MPRLFQQYPDQKFVQGVPTDNVDLTGYAKTAGSVLPGIGDAISVYDTAKSLKEGNYGEAGLNALGILPFIPSLGGITKNIKNLDFIPIGMDLGIGPRHPEFNKIILENATKAASLDNFIPITLKSGENVKIVPFSDGGYAENRFIVLNKDNNRIGDMTFSTRSDEPAVDVWVDEKYRRKGLATQMYGTAEQYGGAIPKYNSSSFRTEEGEAFRKALENKNKESYIASPFYQDPFGNTTK